MQSQVESLKELLQELQREAGALNLLARVHDSAHLNEEELHIVQGALAPHLPAAATETDLASTQLEAGLSEALRELVSRGCSAHKLLAVARSLLGSGSAAEAGAGASEGEEADWPAAQLLVSNAVVSAVQDGISRLQEEPQAADESSSSLAGAMHALECAVTCLEARTDMAQPAAAVDGDEEAVRTMRQDVWDMLVTFVQEGGSASSGAVSGVLGLVGSIAPDTSQR